MSAPAKTGDQVRDAIDFAVYAKNLETPGPGFPFWLDKCLDFDTPATLRWIRNTAKNGTLVPDQREAIAKALKVRPRTTQAALRAGIVRLKQSTPSSSLPKAETALER